MRFDAGDFTFDYSDDGRGLAVVLVHGFANDRSMWQGQVEALRGRYRIVAVDLRGHGGSTGADGSAIAMETYASDIAALLNHLGIARAVVGGISMGGYVALAFALRYPGRTAGLVLANTRAAADNPEWKAFREAMVLGIGEKGAAYVVENYGGKPLRADAPPAILHEMQAMIRRQRQEGLVSGVRAMAARPDRVAELSSIRVPTLVIHGTDDRFIPASEAEVLHRGIAGSRFVNIPGAGHLSNMDSAEAFNAALDAFLAPLSKANAA